MLKAALIFQNGMVLQRDKKISFWGTAEKNREISITLQGKTASGYSDENGNWSIMVGPLSASASEEVVVTCGDEKLCFSDVQVGDVWLAGGQSNMEFFMRYDADYEEELKLCENPNIRFFDYPEVSYEEQLDEADYFKNFAKWRKADSENLEWFSAVGYYFAKEIQANQNVPIGIIGCNWGGTPACAWMDEAAIKNGGGEVFLEEYAKAVENLDLEEYNKNFLNDPSGWKTDPFSDTFGDLLMRGFGIEDILEKITGKRPNPAEINMDEYNPVVGPKYERRPMGLYHSMLKQVVPYGLKGFLYYQGETDGDTHPECYEGMLSSLIECWRNLWKEKLPFLFVQLAPFGKWLNCDGTPYSIIRKAQQRVSETVENTGMAVISDVGMEWDIHPKKKQPVGYRLALQAENKVYGQSVVCEAPTLSEAAIKADTLVLHFDNVGEGLHIQSESGELTGIKLFSNAKQLDLNGMKANANGNIVTIYNIESVDSVRKVIFGDGGWYQINLYNSAGIPARPAQVCISE